VMEGLIGKTRNSQMHQTNSGASMPSFTKEDFQRAIQDPRYHSDPAFRKEILSKAESVMM